jgi:hypothetical protein
MAAVGVGCVVVARRVESLLTGDLLKQLQSPRSYLSFRNCFAQCAIGFMRMAAIVKAALPEIARKLHEALFDAAEAQVMQAEGLHAGAVD